MSPTLPDVAVTEPSTLSAPLRWVGMQDIAIPVQLETGSSQLAARASVQVDLPRAELKGIHMSRLYRLLDTHLQQPLSPAMLAVIAGADRQPCRLREPRRSADAQLRTDVTHAGIAQ